MLSAMVSRRSAIQMKIKYLLILSVKVMFVLIKANKTKTETKGAKFVCKINLNAENENSIPLFIIAQSLHFN